MEGNVALAKLVPAHRNVVKNIMPIHSEQKIKSVLIVQSSFGEMYEPSWQRALRELGINAELFDTHSYIPPNLAGRFEEHYLLGPDIGKVNRMVIERVREMRPDVVLFYQGHHYERDTIEQVAKMSFTVGSHCDDPFRKRGSALYRHLKKAMPAYDGYHVNRHCNVAEANACGLKQVRVLMTYYIPWLHQPSSLSPQEQQIWESDVVFVGHAEPDVRIECLTKSVRAGIKFKIFGGDEQWKPAIPHDVYRAIQPTPRISPADCRKALCASKIGACFFSKWNRDQYTHRSWEIPACGVFLLSERTPAMQEFYVEGKEAEFFDTADEFVDKLQFYLRNEGARKRIAEAGQAAVATSGNDIYSRMKQWLSDVAEWRSEKKLGN